MAVTGLSLPNLSATHWLARACLLFAVISGCLSVYYSCVLQRIIGQLYSPALVREWLRLSSKDDWETASLAAIFTLSAPFELMGVSIFSFLLGLAVYQGFTWIYSLDTAAGPHDSRNVFIFFIVGTGFCGIFFSSTFTLKFAENLLRQDQRPRARSSAPFNSDPVAEHDRSRHTGGQMMESRQNRFARISEDETLPAKELSAVLEAAAQAQIQCAEANQALALAYLRASRSQQETTQGTAQECRI